MFLVDVLVEVLVSSSMAESSQQRKMTMIAATVPNGIWEDGGNTHVYRALLMADT